MRFVFASFVKDLARWRRDSAAFLIWLAIPFLIGGLMTALIGGGGGSGPSGSLLIADQDDTLLSGAVVAAFQQDQLGQLLTVQSVTAAEGADKIAAGEASGFLILPAGFQDAFLNEVPLTVTLKTNPSQTILPGIIQDVTEILLDLGFYVQAVFGPELKTIQDADLAQSPKDIFVADVAVQIQHKIDVVQPKLFPPLIDLQIVEPPPSAPEVDLGLLYLPGIVMMALLFAAQGLSSDFWKERGQGTLRRLVSSPGIAEQFVLGKALAATVTVAIIAGITLLAGFFYHDIIWSKFVPSLVWIIVAGAGFFAWFAALQMLFPNQKAASLLTTIVLFPMMMLGGSFFPLDVLPDWLAAIGRRSPNGFVVDRLTVELTSPGAWSFTAQNWTLLIAVALSGLVICSWRLKSGFARR